MAEYGVVPVDAIMRVFPFIVHVPAPQRDRYPVLVFGTRSSWPSYDNWRSMHADSGSHGSA